MSRILHLDLSTGASGDKMFGALFEVCEQLGLVSFDDLASRAKELMPQVTITREQHMNGGVLGTHLVVLFEDRPIEELGLTSHGSHTHRHWSDIQEIITDAAEQNIVDEATAERALRIFTRVATAEAKVHGVSLKEVHFHEVGSADSIIDILFNSFLYTTLNPDTVYATPLALGSGTFICAHGELPVPAPATAEILNNSQVSVYASSHVGELTTPTGAALVAEFVDEFAPLPCSLPQATGYGAGVRHIEGAANVLRALCAEPASLAGLSAQEESGILVEGVTQLECNLDHLSAEAISFACEELLSLGALDVWQESITMKKGRLASKLMLLVKPLQASEFAQKLIELTGTLGVRSSYLERAYVAREVIMLETPYGPVPYKSATVGSGESETHWLRPEHDAVARLAREHNLNYTALYEELQKLAD